MTEAQASAHASAVLVGAKAILIRGPSGSGKSRLALRLLQSLPFARLVGDDRVYLQAANGRLLVHPAKELAGLLEIRGLGIRRLPFEPLAVVGLVVDLAAHAGRMPEPSATQTGLAGISLPCLGLPPDTDPLPILLAALVDPRAAIDRRPGLG
jgi:HPr kinase/phosphorylase